VAGGGYLKKALFDELLIILFVIVLIDTVQV